MAQGRTVGKSAAQWLVDTVNASPGEVSVLALGPLTNVALALQLDERVTHNMVRCPRAVWRAALVSPLWNGTS